MTQARPWVAHPSPDILLLSQEPDRLSPEQIFEELSRLLDIDEILQLYRTFRSISEDQVRQFAQNYQRNCAFDAASNRSSRSSLVSRFSRFSFASTNSSSSQDLTATSYHSATDAHVHIPQPSQFQRDEALFPSETYPQLAPNEQLQSSFEASTPGLEQMQRSFSPHLPQATEFSCVPCDKSFTSAATLAKHQAEFCERRLDWICTICPDKTFGLLERLNRHHLEAHSETCSQGCDRRSRQLAEMCKLQLTKCVRNTPEKKAWGCPCCVSCFRSIEDWNRHKTCHSLQNGRVKNWSFSTMMVSLLSHPHLQPFMSEGFFKDCDWSTLSHEASRNLRYALERHQLPLPLLSHSEYIGLDVWRTLVKYARSSGLRCRPLPSTPESMHSRAPSPFRRGDADRSDGHRVCPDAQVPGQKALGYPLSTLDGVESLGAGLSFPLRTDSRNYRVQNVDGIITPGRMRAGTAVDPPRRTFVQHASREDVPDTVVLANVSKPGASVASNFDTNEDAFWDEFDPYSSDQQNGLQSKVSLPSLHRQFTPGHSDMPQGENCEGSLPTWDASTFDHSDGAAGHVPEQSLLRRESSRPVTPAHSDKSDGSWTKFLKSDSLLPSVRDSMDMLDN